MFRNPFKGFLYFSKSDRRAFFAICCIVVFCAGVVCVVDSIDRSSEPNAKEDVDLSTGASRRNMASGRLFSGVPSGSVSLHSFDPNVVDSLTLLSFGIKAYKVRNFLRYRSAGKVFMSAKDMGSTYGWTQDDVDYLASYVNVDIARADSIRKAHGRRVRHGGSARFLSERGVYGESAGKTSDSIGKREGYTGKREKYAGKRNARPSENGIVWSQGGEGANKSLYAPKFDVMTVVDVNEADSATLRRIPGVGEKTCKAIIKYRERLGGLYDVEQLLDIKLVSRDLLKWFEVKDDFVVRKLKINSASFNELNSHPYIKYEQAKDLLAYIRLYGIIANERVLCSTGIFSEGEARKLGPYVDYSK